MKNLFEKIIAAGLLQPRSPFGEPDEKVLLIKLSSLKSILTEENPLPIEKRSDEELLELAAETIALHHSGYRSDCTQSGLEIQHANGTSALWNSLRNEGHAFSLAVANEIITYPKIHAKTVQSDFWHSVAQYLGDKGAMFQYSVTHDKEHNPMAATCRAITLVAAKRALQTRKEKSDD